MKGPENLRDFATVNGEGAVCPWLPQGKDATGQLSLWASLLIEAGCCLPLVAGFFFLFFF